MVEKSLVYIHSTSPTRRFVGCGALIEGGTIATCRHVWRMATAKAEPATNLTVEIEYPWSWEGKTTISKPATLAYDCEETDTPSPDLVLLRPEAVPNGVVTLQLAVKEGLETGAGYALVGLVGKDAQNPKAVRVVRIEGAIAPDLGTDGRRQFTGGNAQGYWSEAGSSGSPVFVTGGQQLAGILSLSELGANQGQSPLHEGFVVPATTIRQHLSRLVAAPVAAKQGIDPAALQPILDQFGARDVPVAEIPSRLLEFVLAARAQAAQPAPRSNEGADIDATIGAARDKVGKFDTTGARAVLQTKIAEEEQARTRRMVPLLKERALVERLAFDHAAAKTTYGEIIRLAPDDAWAWFELGDLWVTAGSLDEATKAYRGGEAAARRTADERDISVSYNKIGEVRQAEGDLSGALAAYSEGLAIAERLAARDPNNALWQHDISVSHIKIGDVRHAQRDLEGALAAYRLSHAIRVRLAAREPDNAVWQRELSISQNWIGNVLLEQRDLNGALVAYLAYNTMAERLAAQYPANTEWQRDLLISHVKVGDVRFAQGNLEGAHTAFRAGLAIAERLAALDPGNVQWQRDLIVSCMRTAKCDPTAARALLGRAQEIAAGLKSTGRLAPVDAAVPAEIEQALRAAGAEGQMR